MVREPKKEHRYVYVVVHLKKKRKNLQPCKSPIRQYKIKEREGDSGLWAMRAGESCPTTPHTHSHWSLFITSLVKEILFPSIYGKMIWKDLSFRCGVSKWWPQGQSSLLPIFIQSVSWELINSWKNSKEISRSNANYTKFMFQCPMNNGLLEHSSACSLNIV